MTTLSLSSAAPTSVDADALVIGVVATPSGPSPTPDARPVDEALGSRLTSLLAAMGAEGKAEEVTKIPTFDALRPGMVLAVGLGDRPDGDVDDELLRRAAGAAVRAAAGSRSVGVLLPAASAEQVSAVAEGALLGSYAFDRYRTGDAPKAPVENVTVLTAVADQPAATEARDRAETVASAVRLARDLVNTPPSDLHPQEFADIAASTAAAAGLTVDVLDEQRLRDQGYGGILGVGQGSVHPPRLVRLEYRPGDAAGGETRTLALVGKGVTFDSGGLSLKPSASMDWMKSDMAGAAAVLGALTAIARLRTPLRVVGYLPLVENMPSGSAQRPSDVLTTYGGKTVEVMNTDAEGRLILADALVRSTEDRPDLVVDTATLTGAQLVALGTRTAAVMASDDEVRDGVVRAGARAGESLWPMPLPDELRKGLDSPVADIANVAGDRWAGMLVAGVFLREFVPAGVRWAHLDIAGPSFNKQEAYGYTPKGGTGMSTRTLVQIAEDLAHGRLCGPLG